MTHEQYERLTALITDCLIDLRRVEATLKLLKDPRDVELRKAKALLEGVRSDIDREHRR